MVHPVIYKPSFRKLAAYLAVPVLFYAFVVIVPLLWSLWYSLHTDFNYQLSFVGGANYLELVTDSSFWFTIRNNLIIIGLSVVFQIGAGFLIAVLMNSNFVRAQRFYRAVIFFPVILSPVVVAMLWILIYNLDQGLLNVMLRAVGLGAWTQRWLDDPNIVIYSVTAPLIWQFVGLYLVIFLAGLSAIPQEVLEAAEIDGANFVRKTQYVTLPLLVTTWKVVLIIAISGGLKIFAHTFVMTGGGPGLASTVVAQYAYEQSIGRLRFTYGTTIAVGIVALSFAIILVTNYLLSRFESD